MEPNYWLSTIRIGENDVSTSTSSCDAAPDERILQLQKRLDMKGIETRPLWKPMHLQPVYKDAPAYVNGVGESLFRCGLCLPSNSCVTKEQVCFIADEVKKAWGISEHVA